MCPLMTYQVLFSLEIFPTICAQKGFLPCVDSLMNYEICLPGEPPHALSTDKGLLPGVSPAVSLKVSFVGEFEATVAAAIKLFTSVDSLVNNQMVLEIEALLAILTGIRSLLHVCLLVAYKMLLSKIASPTKITWEWFLGKVGGMVPNQILVV